MRHGLPADGPGEVRPLTLFGAPVLHSECNEVTDFGPRLNELVSDMFATMYAANGVGLAANQLGVPLRLFVYDCPDDEDVRHRGHVINPHLVDLDGVDIGGPEGCLSLPGLEARTVRAEYACVEGVRADGTPVRIEAEGFFARCLQHECDHLDGLVYADRLGRFRRWRLLRAVARSDWGAARLTERLPSSEPPGHPVR